MTFFTFDLWYSPTVQVLWTYVTLHKQKSNKRLLWPVSSRRYSSVVYNLYGHRAFCSISSWFALIEQVMQNEKNPIYLSRNSEYRTQLKYKHVVYEIMINCKWTHKRIQLMIKSSSVEEKKCKFICVLRSACANFMHRITDCPLSKPNTLDCAGCGTPLVAGNAHSQVYDVWNV